MADDNSSDGSATANDQGVLANLPRSRPQRASARRIAARDGTGAASSRSRARTSATRSGRAARSSPQASGSSSRKRQPTAPVQGFDSDGEAATGSVQPPGAVELLASAAEVVSELAKAGLSRSERLVKDVISRLPLS